MPDTTLPPRDPIRLLRVTKALMLPIVAGMAAAFMLGYWIADTEVGTWLTVIYSIAAAIGAIKFLNSSEIVDNYVRGIRGEKGGAGAAIAAAEMVTTVVVNR